jgi:hypothetical protein
MKQLILRSAITIIGILVAIVCIYINYNNLIEAFGSGSPYYGQTINMDKWSNPIPFLVILDVLVITIFYGLLKLYKKYMK